jgi:hypothetical protein
VRCGNRGVELGNDGGLITGNLPETSVVRHERGPCALSAGLDAPNLGPTIQMPECDAFAGTSVCRAPYMEDIPASVYVSLLKLPLKPRSGHGLELRRTSATEQVSLDQVQHQLHGAVPHLGRYLCLNINLS